MEKHHQPQLVLPLVYEDIEKLVGTDMARLLQFIVPVIKAERQLTLLLNDVRTSGYLVFVHGVSGSGKSTFINSLQYQGRLPIRELRVINADRLGKTHSHSGKLKTLYQRLTELADYEETLPNSGQKSIVIINYLENLHDETENAIRAFFRDLNPLLRRTPFLVLWPVTDLSEAQEMLGTAQSVASTLFNRRLPILYFTGPEVGDYARITKNTIRVLNKRELYDFKLTDDDLDDARRRIEELPQPEQTIRRYLEYIRDVWETRANYIREIMRNIPIPTELWFVVCYPDAERSIGAFSTKSTGITEDNWSVNIAKLQEYVRGGQRAAQWPGDRLSLALGAIPTKVLYLPTNSFINAIAAYGTHMPKFPVSREMFQAWGDQENWFHKSKSRLTLARSPIIRQLAGLDLIVGERRKGRFVKQAIKDATKPFEEINKAIAHEWSDKPFNQALCMALQDAYSNPPAQETFPDTRPTLVFNAETRHPYMNVTPDILIEVPETKFVCIEMHYTAKPQGSQLAHYILSKLDDYMAQWEMGREGYQTKLL